MDGTPLNIEAGNDEYYMNSSWYRQDASNLYVYKANLAKQNGSGYQVTILINDYRPTLPDALMNPDSALWLGDHLYNDNSSTGLTQNVTFKPVKPMDPSSYYGWTVTDGVTPKSYGGTGDEGYSISCVLDAGKTYSVTLNYNDGLGVCGQSHVNVFNVGSKLQTTVVAVRDPNASELKYNFSYTLPSQYNGVNCLWQFPNASTDTNPLTTRVFQQGTYVVKLKLTDNTGDSCLSYYQVNATNGQACDANYVAIFAPVQNIRLYSTVTVLLTDPNGKVYSTQGLVQPQSSNFEIMNVSDYNANEKGEPTKRLKVKFNCVVKNGNTEINLKNGEARIAVSYK